MTNAPYVAYLSKELGRAMVCSKSVFDRYATHTVVVDLGVKMINSYLNYSTKPQIHVLY